MSGKSQKKIDFTHVINTTTKLSFWLYYYCDPIFAKNLETSIYGGEQKGTSSQITDLVGNGNTPSSQRTYR